MANNIAKVSDDYFSGLEKSKETWKNRDVEAINAETEEIIDLNEETSNSYESKKNQLIKLFEQRKQMQEKGIRSGEEYKANGEAIEKLREEIKDDLQKEIDSYEQEINKLKDSTQSDINDSIIETNQAELDNLNQLLNSKIVSSFDDGDLYHQVQNNGVNCGMTSFLVAVNILLGENTYTDNVGEWAKMGSYSEAIGWGNSTLAQSWIEMNGLQDQLEVTSVESVHSKEELIQHLEEGEVVVASAGGSVFKRNNGSKDNLNHYICFYRTEDGNCYANDSAVGADAGAGVMYTPEDLDAFFNAGSNGSLTVRMK